MKRSRPDAPNSTAKRKTARKAKIAREFINMLRGKYKGAGLLAALMEEKKREREL